MLPGVVFDVDVVVRGDVAGKVELQRPRRDFGGAVIEDAQGSISAGSPVLSDGELGTGIDPG